MITKAVPPVKNVEVSANLGRANPSTASSMVMRRG
jgi:hypothetical protein